MRALAETSEKSSQEVQKLAAAIEADVREVATALQRAAEAAVNESKAGAAVVEVLDGLRADMQKVADGSQQTLSDALRPIAPRPRRKRVQPWWPARPKNNRRPPARRKQRCRSRPSHWSKARRPRRSWRGSPEATRTGRVELSSTEQISATAEQLSATIQQPSSASRQIMTALGQINRGTQQQAAATQQTSAALSQIEKSAKRARENGAQGNERVAKMADNVKQSSGAVAKLVAGVATGLDNTRACLKTMARLEFGRPADREDRVRHLTDRGPDDHAGGQRIG